MQKLILVGAGGHCKSCIDVIESQKKYKIIGLIDNKKRNTNEFDYPIIGSDNQLEFLRKKYKYALVTVGQIQTAKIRKKIFNQLVKFKFTLPFINSKKSYVSKHAKINDGTLIMHHSLVNAYSYIGKNCIINSSAIIEHDSIISDHCHISTGSIINGNVIVGEGTFIGSRAVIIQGIKIGNNCLIGAGSIINKDLPDNDIVK